MKKLIYSLAVAAMFTGAGAQEVDQHPITSEIPGGLAPEETPMFVCFGWDDNAYADAMLWSDSLFKDKVNKDGSPARGTYFISAGLASDHFRDVGGQTPEDVKNSWRSAYNNGHEIGNHTFSHPNGGTKQAGDGSAGQNFTQDQWYSEMKQAQDSLSVILGISQEEILGFRTPYLGVNQGDFDAQKAMGIKYDCSIEYGYGQGWDDHELEGGSYWNGMAAPETRKKLFWPFTLENGWQKSKADGFELKNMYAPEIKAPGQWMFTVYTYLKPASVGTGEVTGFDGNMWTSKMLKEDFFNTLKYNFDLQRSGNKCPITINTHTDNYSEWSPGNEGKWKYDENWQNRREAIAMFLDYVLQFDDVRVVPFKDVISWIKNPVKSSEYVAPTKKAIGGVAVAEKGALQNRGISMKAENRNLNLTIPSTGTYSIRVSSLSGRVLGEIHSGNITAGDHSFSLKNISAAAGVYLVQVQGTANGVARVLLK